VGEFAAAPLDSLEPLEPFDPLDVLAAAPLVEPDESADDAAADAAAGVEPLVGAADWASDGAFDWVSEAALDGFFAPLESVL
jgi:hypothetical protein